MGLFSRFNKKEENAGRSTDEKTVKSALLQVSEKLKLTADSVMIRFAVPEELKASFAFEAGQYVNVTFEIDGKKEIRSYSICSGEDEGLAIGVKAVLGGKVSNEIVQNIEVGSTVDVSVPYGNFKLGNPAKHIVAFAAGSGITPILSLAKKVAKQDGNITLFYGNKSKDSVMFAEEVANLANCTTKMFYSQETIQGALHGRMNKQMISEAIKADLSILRADQFYLCGPEDMIIDIQEVLMVFGVKKENIHFELFTTPVHMKSEETVSTAFFEGKSHVSALLDGELFQLELDTKGSTILDALDKKGADVPYSCRGGVCCTCKAKIIEGSVRMNVNFALTDEEVSQGYILACQSHPTSEVLKLDFNA